MYGLAPAVLSYAARPCPAAPGEALELPLITAEIPAGFSSPAEHYLVEPVDLAGFLVRRPKVASRSSSDAESCPALSLVLCG